VVVVVVVVVRTIVSAQHRTLAAAAAGFTHCFCWPSLPIPIVFPSIGDSAVPELQFSSIQINSTSKLQPVPSVILASISGNVHSRALKLRPARPSIHVHRVRSTRQFRTRDQ
jgi:hypothetical protein